MMERKQFFINLISNFLSVFFQVGVGFVLTPYIIRTLGVEAYGFFPLSNNLIGYIGLITVALNSMGSRFIIINLQQNKLEDANQYFSTLFYSNILLSIGLGIIGFVFTFFIQHLLDVPAENLADVKLLFYFIVINFVISLSTSILDIGPMTANRLDITATRNIILLLLRAFMLFALFSFFTPRLYYLGVTSLLVTVILAAINWNLIRKFLPDFKINFQSFKFKRLKELLSSGVWNALNQLSILLLTQLDLVLANVFLSALIMGQLSITKVVPGFIQSIVGMVVGVFIPKFYMLYGKGEKQNLLNELFFSIKIVSILVIIPISYFVVYGVDFFRLYTPKEDIELINRLSILTIVPMIVTGSINTLFNIYAVTNKTKTPALVWLVFGVVNTIVIYLCIKFTSLGVYSIPIVGLITGLIRNLIFTPIYGAYCLDLKWTVFYSRIFKGMLCGILMIIICYIFKYQFHIIPKDWWQFVGVAVCTGSLALVGSIFLNFDRSTLIHYYNLILNQYVRKN